MTTSTPSSSPSASRSGSAEAHTWDGPMIRYARRNSPTVVRLALAGVLLWFGLLKLLGASPVVDLVGKAVPFIPQEAAVLATGTVEVAIGLGLLTGLAPRLTLALFFALLLGTFSLLITNPEIAFGGNPLKLTTTGEFIFKNVVLIAAGLVLVAAIPIRPRRDESGSRRKKAGRR